MRAGGVGERRRRRRRAPYCRASSWSAVLRRTPPGALVERIRALDVDERARAEVAAVVWWERLGNQRGESRLASPWREWLRRLDDVLEPWADPAVVAAGLVALGWPEEKARERAVVCWGVEVEDVATACRGRMDGDEVCDG